MGGSLADCGTCLERPVVNVAFSEGFSRRVYKRILELVERCTKSAGDFNPQDIASPAWAFATLSQPDTQLFSPLAREAQRRAVLELVTPQNLANTARTTGTLQLPSL